MQNGQVLNLGVASSERPQPAPPPPQMSGDLAQMGDALEQTRADVRRTRMQIQQQSEEHQAHLRRTKAMSIVLVILAFGLITAMWFAYPTVKGQGRSTAEILGLKNLAGAMGDRMTAAEAQLNKWTETLPGVTGRMDQLQADMKTNLQSARTQTQSAVTQMGQRIKADVNQSLQAVQSRLSGLESNQREAHETVAQLQQQVAGLRRELAGVRDEATAAADRFKQLQESHQAASTELSGMKETVVSNQAALGTISHRLDRQRVEFQVAKNKTEQVAPGLFLTVKNLDIKKQQIDGLLKIAAEDRSFSISQQSIQKPITFYARGENRPTEVVLTQVGKNGVSGYVTVPGQVATASKTDSSER